MIRNHTAVGLSSVGYPRAWTEVTLPGDLWRRDAACSHVDPELFYPEKGGSAAAAKRICEGCPVRAECLVWALERGERFGVWGGLSERERRRLLVPEQRRSA